jgi:hypothetical protein
MIDPYINLEVTDEYIIRKFDENIDPVELMWHMDNEDRLVEALESTDWLVQLDDSLPILLDKPIFIPKHVYHRTIKGTGSLLVKIKKYD